MTRTIASVARSAGVTVRTLHHYDHVGLLKPSRVGANGYRSYSRADVERLQFILLLRQLDFPLEDIRTLLEQPGFDRREALQKQLDQLRARHRELGSLIRVLTRTLKAGKGGTPMKDKELFDGLQQARLQEEAREKWGNTRAWKESQEKTRKYSKEEWAQIQKEALDAARGVADNMDKGADSEEVQRFVRAHHQHIHSRFYSCNAEMYDGLAQMWVDDPRFTAWWDAVKPGLAVFMRKAVDVYVYNLLLEDERR